MLLPCLMHQVAKQEIRHIPLLPPDDEMVELRNQFSLMLSRLEAGRDRTLLMKFEQADRL
jgi:hypothetical protein